MRRCDTLLAGRRTYEEMTAYWLPLADDPAAGALEREISEFHRHADKLVVSDSLTDADLRAERTTILSRSGAADALRALEDTDGGDIVMFGSLTLLHALLAADVVDELHLVVGNAATGGGTPLLPAATPRLRLLGTWRGAGSDNVVLQYATR